MLKGGQWTESSCSGEAQRHTGLPGATPSWIRLLRNGGCYPTDLLSCQSMLRGIKPTTGLCLWIFTEKESSVGKNSVTGTSFQIYCSPNEIE